MPAESRRHFAKARCFTKRYSLMKENKNKNKVILLTVLLAFLFAAVMIYDSFFCVEKSAGEKECSIVFSDRAVMTDNEEKVAVTGKSAVIAEGGKYRISGKCAEGSLIIDTRDEDTVQLYMENLELTNTEDAPVCILSCKNTEIFISGENKLEDGSAATAAEDRKSGCLYSRKDLSLEGDGSLYINAGYHHGISVRADLDCSLTNLQVTAAANAIDVKDALFINRGNIRLEAGGDGISAKNSEDADMGRVYIKGGNIQLRAADDGISAEEDIEISGGDIYIECGDKLYNCDNNVSVAEGCVRGGSY